MQVKKVLPSGEKILTFEKSPEYEALQLEFNQVQSTMSIENLMRFLQKNFYHHEAIVYFADFLRLQGKFPDA